MYFPYLRGKQFELRAITDLCQSGLFGAHVIPIIEPVNKSLPKVLLQFKKLNQPVSVIKNPQVGNYLFATDSEIVGLWDLDFLIPATLVTKQSDYASALSSSDVRKMRIITRQSPMPSDSSSLLANQSLNVVCIDHPLYSEQFSDKVLLRDPFNRQSKNADYLKHPDELFSTDHLTFRSLGCTGFSDYSIVGDHFQTGGSGPARAVAVHIVYFDDNNYLRIHHFVSDNNKDTKDVAKKLNEALAHFSAWYHSAEFDVEKNDSMGLHKFEDMYQEGSFHNLGYVKQLSLEHHFEIISRFLTLHEQAN